ncbi:hypothetical protein PRIC1_001944 [Phytophthora ramorum]
MGSGAGGRQDVKKDTVDFSGLPPRMSESIDTSWKNGWGRRANSCTNTRGGETIALTTEAGSGDWFGKEKLAQLRLDSGCKRVKWGELSNEICGNETSTCWPPRLEKPGVKAGLPRYSPNSLAGVGGSCRGEANSPSSRSSRRISLSSETAAGVRRSVSTKPFAKNILGHWW